MLLVLVRVAAAQPATTPTRFETCTAERKTRMATALQIADADERARALLAMPECRREADGTTDVIDPRAPVAPEAAFQSRIEAELVAGVAASAIGYQVRQAFGFGPAVELAGAWHGWRRLSLGASAGYVGFDDSSYLGSYDVRHRFFDLAGRAWLHLGPAKVGAGIGVQIDDAMAFADISGHRDANPFFEVAARCDVERVRFAELVVFGALSYVTSSPDANNLSYAGDVLSARLGIGVRL